MKSFIRAPENDLHRLCADCGPVITTGIVLKRALWDNLLPWSLMKSMWQLPVHLTRVVGDQLQNNGRNILLGGLTTGILIYTGYKIYNFDQVRQRQQEEEQQQHQLLMQNQTNGSDHIERFKANIQLRTRQKYGYMQERTPAIGRYDGALALLEVGCFGDTEVMDQVLQYSNEGKVLWKEVHDAKKTGDPQ